MSYALNTTVSSRLIIIESSRLSAAQKPSGINSHVNVDIGNSFQCHTGEHLILRLVSATFTSTIYGITSSDNAFTLKKKVGDVWVTTPGALGIGNWATKDICSQLEVAMKNALNISEGLDVRYNKATAKVSIEFTNAPSYDFEIVFDTCYRAFGFNKGQIISFGPGKPSTIEAPNIAIINDVTYAKVVCPNLLTTSCFAAATGTYEGVLGVLPVTAYNSVNYYEASSRYPSIVLSDKAITSIELKILDQDDNLIDWNGCEYVLVLAVDVVRDLDRGENNNLRDQATREMAAITT